MPWLDSNDPSHWPISSVSLFIVYEHNIVKCNAREGFLPLMTFHESVQILGTPSQPKQITKVRHPPKTCLAIVSHRRVIKFLRRLNPLIVGTSNESMDGVRGEGSSGAKGHAREGYHLPPWRPWPTQLQIPPDSCANMPLSTFLTAPIFASQLPPKCDA